MNTFIINLNNNIYFLFAVSLSSLLGFMLSIYVTYKSHNISKILKRMETIQAYNESKTQFAERFKGYKDSILKDNLNTRQILHSILEDIFKFEIQYRILLSKTDFIKLFFIKFYLKKKFKKVNFDKVCNYLDFLIGRCYKKEENR
ncbi:hypothetical protein [Clostridium oceanicum]|uniref:Uncharacterized protein n=1 Tax=Clostridium oceanicum TaxID=1543 RepID=A0ABN1JCC3_9CLOT